MKIFVIGVGVVGEATLDGISRFEEDTIGYDIDETKITSLENKGFKMTKKLLDADVFFICVQEWFVEDVLKELAEFLKTQPVRNRDIVIRSTVPPGTTETFAKKYSLNLIHNPEFLTAKSSIYDFLDPDMIVIGIPHCSTLHHLPFLYEKFRKPIIYTTSTMSEMVKLSINSFLSTMISYWNTIHEISKRLNINSHELGKICSLDSRVPIYGSTMHGKKFGGFCLPKDLDALIKTAETNNYHPTLLKAVKKVNEEMQ